VENLEMKNDDDIDNPPLWGVTAVAVLSLLAIFGGFSLIMMCVGYVWEKAA
jgi:hypothetical protein